MCGGGGGRGGGGGGGGCIHLGIEEVLTESKKMLNFTRRQNQKIFLTRILTVVWTIETYCRFIATPAMCFCMSPIHSPYIKVPLYCTFCEKRLPSKLDDI